VGNCICALLCSVEPTRQAFLEADAVSTIARRLLEVPQSGIADLVAPMIALLKDAPQCCDFAEGPRMLEHLLTVVRRLDTGNNAMKSVIQLFYCMF